MQTRVTWMIALVLGMSAFTGCGDDDDGDDDGSGKDGGTVDGGKTNGGSGKGAGGTGGSGMVGNGSGGAGAVSVPCGTSTCMSSALTTGIIDACCADEETNTCGQSTMGGACMTSPDPDPRCPDVSLGGLGKLSSCCTADGQCGVNGSALGGGCVALSQLSMAMPFLAVLQITIPEPRACDAVDGGVEVQDAGQ